MFMQLLIYEIEIAWWHTQILTNFIKICKKGCTLVWSGQMFVCKINRIKTDGNVYPSKKDNAIKESAECLQLPGSKGCYVEQKGTTTPSSGKVLAYLSQHDTSFNIL